MRLNAEQAEILRRHLQSTFRGGCTSCGNPNWTFDDVIFELRQFVGGGISTEGLIKPCIALTCTNCGHVELLNAFSTGVIRLEQQGSMPQANQEAFSETPAEPLEA